MTARLTPQQIEVLTRLGSATLHEAQGMRGAMDSRIKPLDATRRLVGTAYCVDARPNDNLVLHYAVSDASVGDILVVDAKGFVESGPWGDLLTLAAQIKGIAGMVIDGSVRDSEAIIQMGFPLFCRGLSIKGTLKNQPGFTRVPVVCGGVTIRHGDVIVGDADGVVAIAAEDLESVMAAGLAREDKEARIRERLLAGETTIEILGLGNALERLGMQ